MQHALIDLCVVGASTSYCIISCTSCMGSVSAEIFSGVSEISSSCTLLPLTTLERNSFSKKKPIVSFKHFALCFIIKTISFDFPRNPTKKHLPDFRVSLSDTKRLT
jgi:hypothetical protein